MLSSSPDRAPIASDLGDAYRLSTRGRRMSASRASEPAIMARIILLKLRNSISASSIRYARRDLIFC